MMIFVNSVYKEEAWNLEYAKNFIKLLNPIAPHITEEIWREVFNNKETIAYESWPTYDESKMISDTYEMVVQINGKVRGKIEVSTSCTEEEIKTIAKDMDKEIVVPKKIINIVIK